MIRRLLPFGIVAAFSAVLVSYLAYTWQLAEEMRDNAAVFSQIYFQVVQAVASPEGMTAEALLTEAERVNRFGFTPSELERAKASRLRAVQVAYNERETTDSRRYATAYIHSFLRDEVEPGIEKELQSVDITGACCGHQGRSSILGRKLGLRT